MALARESGFLGDFGDGSPGFLQHASGRGKALVQHLAVRGNAETALEQAQEVKAAHAGLLREVGKFQIACEMGANVLCDA